MNAGWKSIRFVITSTSGGSQRRVYRLHHSAAKSDDICSFCSSVISVFNRFLKKRENSPKVIYDSDSLSVTWALDLLSAKPGDPPAWIISSCRCGFGDSCRTCSAECPMIIHGHSAGNIMTCYSFCWSKEVDVAKRVTSKVLENLIVPLTICFEYNHIKTCVVVSFQYNRDQLKHLYWIIY